MTEKNHLFMGRDGKRIDIKITAISEESAIRMYQLIDRALVEVLRSDLESEWNRDSEGGDRS